jgi:hypothetical protein
MVLPKFHNRAIIHHSLPITDTAIQLKNDTANLSDVTIALIVILVYNFVYYLKQTRINL